MAVQHSTLSGAQLHEPKGLSASSDKQYNMARTGANSWEILVGADSDTASASSEIIINGLGDYAILIITYQDLLPATSGILQLRFSSDNGSSFHISDYYAGFNQDGISEMQTGFTQFNLDVVNSTAYQSGKLIVSNFNKAVPSAVYGHITSSEGSNFTTNIASKGFKGFVNSATAWNAIRIYNYAGNITSGKIIIEGIKS